MRRLLIPAGFSLLFVTACSKEEEPAPAGEELLPGEDRAFEELQKEGREAWEALKDYGFQKKEEYRRQMDAALDEISKDIEALEEKTRAAGADAQDRLEDEIKTLREKKEAVRERLEKVGATGKEAWDEFSRGLQSAMEDLARAYERAAERVESSEPPDS